jgi:hypothetical protein
MREEIAFASYVLEGSNLFLCFTFLLTAFLIFVWRQTGFFNWIKENQRSTKAIRAFILSLGGFGVFLTLFTVFDMLESRPKHAVIQLEIFLSIAFSLIVLLLSMTAFYFIQPAKDKSI